MNKNKYRIENILEFSNKNWKLREINLIECIKPVYETQQKIKSITAKAHCNQIINIKSNNKEKIKKSTRTKKSLETIKAREQYL